MTPDLFDEERHKLFILFGIYREVFIAIDTGLVKFNEHADLIGDEVSGR